MDSYGALCAAPKDPPLQTFRWFQVDVFPNSFNSVRKSENINSFRFCYLYFVNTFNHCKKKANNCQNKNICKSLTLLSAIPNDVGKRTGTSIVVDYGTTNNFTIVIEKSGNKVEIHIQKD